jgi:hypothetical protein
VGAFENIRLKDLGKKSRPIEVCNMDDERIFAGQAVEVAFQAIKAMHQNLNAYYASKSDPLLFELADMILLLSAQLTLAAGTRANRNLAPGVRKAETESRYPIN